MGSVRLGRFVYAQADEDVSVAVWKKKQFS